MAVPLQETQRHVASFGTTREREFFRYLPPFANTFQHIARDTHLEEITPHPSPDASLSAFAQLGALRFGAERVLISLFGRHEEHIIAEATRTISLRDENSHEPDDELLFGASTVGYDRSLAVPLTKPKPSSAQPSAHSSVIIPDLTQDEVYQHHPDVTGSTKLRFMASTPMVTPKGVVIGAYTVLDSQPRESISDSLFKFLSDMAAIVIEHLQSVRSRSQHLRAERMVVGLGSFLEGKGGLRNWWLEEAESAISPGPEGSGEGAINEEQQDKQQLTGISAAMGANNDKPTALPLGLERAQAIPSPADSPSRNLRRPPLGPPTTSRRSKPHTKSTQGRSEIQSHVENEETKLQSNKDIFDHQVEATFARAANIIRESIEVEAVVFFDCKFDSRGTFVPNPKSDTESGLENSSADEETDNMKRTMPPKILRSVMDDSGQTTISPCKVLGFATSNTASVNDEAKDDANLALSQSFVAGLLRRYPRGKIFNYDEDGSMSFTDSSEGTFTDFNCRPGKRYKKTKKTILRQDALTLRNLAPGSRSIIFSPVWDTHKSKWYAGTLSWTKAPQRIFTVADELTFCMAFGNSLMAEIHRLRALFTDRATADLLAGLSHELRSPLHGIAGTAELLTDTAMDALQRGFVHTIASCASTLLGSIDQLLEYSSVNDLKKYQGAKSPSQYRPLYTEKSPTQPDNPGNGSLVSLDVTLEETIETVYAGFSFLHDSRSMLYGLNAIEQNQSKSTNSLSEVKFVLDIDSSPTWTFATRQGAWNVILTNIVGNALKYTQSGHVSVSAKVNPNFQENSPQSSTVTIVVQDTGCGMDAEFLRNGYFAAFSQENDEVAGNGLGANITKRTMTSLGGELKVSSEKGLGTEVVLSANLEHATNHPSERSLDPHHTYIESVKRLMSKKIIAIVGFHGSELGDAISSSLRRVCERWLGMEVRLISPSSAESSYCDFYIAPHEFLDLGNLNIRPMPFAKVMRMPPPAVVICSSPKLASSLFAACRQRGDSEVLEFITQPCGPQKLAKALETCLKRQARRLAGVSTPGPSILSAPQANSTPISPFSKAKLGSLGKGDLTAPDSAISMQRHLQPGTGLDSSTTPRDYFSMDPPILNNAPVLPLTPHSEPTPTWKPDPYTPGAHESILILLVDDNQINMALLIAFMKKLGLDYLTAQNGQEAFDQFQRHPHRIRIVLMDISMPVMDGLKSTRQIRTFETTLRENPRAIIIALTGVAQDDIQRDAMGSGMDLFLTKPVRLQAISQIIQEYTALDLPLPHRGKCVDHLD